MSPDKNIGQQINNNRNVLRLILSMHSAPTHIVINRRQLATLILVNSCRIRNEANRSTVRRIAGGVGWIEHEHEYEHEHTDTIEW